jgi:hypothetical protein
MNRLPAHREVWIHPCGEHCELAVPLRFLRYVRVEREAADNEDVEADALDGFLGGFLHLLRTHGSVFRTDRHRDAA